MAHPPAIVPAQQSGVQKKASQSTDFPSVEEAKRFFQVARQRLLDVNNWQHIVDSALSSTFILRDAQGRSIAHRLPEPGDYIQIDLPGTGTKAGDGHDWVRIETIEDSQGNEADELTGIRVRPVASPLNDQPEVAHFLDDQATSTFIVSRLGSTVTADIYGRNEVANTDTPGLLDKMRNVATSVGAWLGLADAQWKSLAKAFVAPESAA